ncbi:hypothetical protein [Paracoccus sp. ME4]|uniref:hypothetical protein n=1 Tax=Paracoccus sp. ME4 TaxID=3138066 RepID=UPI00398AF799
MTRLIAAFLLGAYLGAGIFAGLLHQRAVPALNVVGIAWITATWPNLIRCARADAGCDPTGPEWMRPYIFTFPGDRT